MKAERELLEWAAREDHGMGREARKETYKNKICMKMPK